MARLERWDQPNRQRNGEANSRTQLQHAAIDLSGQIQRISGEKQNQRVTAPVRHQHPARCAAY